MELHFGEPMIRWRARQGTHEVLAQSVDSRDAQVMVAYPVRDGNGATRREVGRVPFSLKILAEDQADLMDHPVEFQLRSNGVSIAKHTVTVRECIPILKDSFISVDRESAVVVGSTVFDIHVQIPVTTNRRPRDAIASVLLYRDHAVSVVQKLASHKNAVAMGLLPPIVGCFLGVVLMSPLWVPITLVVGILGFPLWFVIGVGASLVVAISAISSVITIKLVQSKRVKASIRELAQSPSGQFLLFSEVGNKRMLTPSEFASRLKAYINEEPSRKLVASLVIDFIGNATFVVPRIGELADMFWAPASATLISAMYSESTPSAKYFAFVEEILPFTDFIPTATLAWIKENLHADDLRKLMLAVRPKAA